MPRLPASSRGPRRSRAALLGALLGLGAAVGAGGVRPVPVGAAPKGAPPANPAPPKKPVEAQPGVPDAALQQAINEAIDRGAAWLRTQQKPGGAFAPVATKAGAHFEIGSTALAGLALLASGDAPGTPIVDGVLQVCRTKDAALGATGGRTTYDTSVLIMFVTEYFRTKAGPPKDEKGHTRQGRGGGKNPCSLPPDALAWVQDMATWLCGVQKDTGGWGYPVHREDFSNTQYALLGLRAARDCGANVPAVVFERALRLALAWQEPDGPKVKRVVPNPDGSHGPYAFEAGDRSRGFPYLLSPFAATGSMTTSGIAILAIAHDALLRPKRLERYDTALENQTARAIQDGFCWLETNWTVDRNPGAGAPNWHLYYMYGLERACTLAGRDLVGALDWYVLGARKLVSMQKPDGRWVTGALGTPGEFEASDVLDTAWALLFLERATRPATPIPAPVVTKGD